MSLDFGMQRFDEAGDASPKHPRVLADILAAAREAFPQGDDRYDIRQRGKLARVQLASGIGTIRADHAAFNLHDLDENGDLRVIHAIARAGDMVVITEDGCPILTDPRQRARLPEDWVGAQDRVPVAKVWKGLARLLRKATGPATAYREKVVASYESQVEAGPPPTGGAGTTAVYVQPREGEKEMQQLRRLFKFTDTYVAERGGRQIAGTIGGLSWSLRTPTGELFIGCVVTGDVSDWMEFFKAYANAEHRCFGMIEGKRTKFVIDDGRTFGIGECELRRLNDED